MARSVEPLVVGRVIGDVLDMFTPASEFTVRYGTKQVTNGCDIKPSAAADKPHVMVDPDAPSPSEPRLREWLHWIVVDVPEGQDATKGRSNGRKDSSGGCACQLQYSPIRCSKQAGDSGCCSVFQFSKGASS
ncbi:hypothetical protein ERO13_D05G169400v2 [Gossypium hirsutum]|uniref:Uncharacterized protein n=1 Tax=Gossypium tomentosum TaxID=34277 RepID=A0A5D2KWB8_GOSTO|nr:hypothetical protein ERO13_D05G169400v2 [Gossypium hirsutum]TYH71408.1 hypothetical protein ES332_D05G184200v1 [Gossypium tomentosum]TYH71415.1 hypothetical protein ES332_D05G184200v1 [Gossypium tomentosum]